MADAKIMADLEKESQEIEIETNTPQVVEVSILEQLDHSQATTLAMRRAARWQMFSVCFSLFLGGWDAGTMGPLLPKIQSFYHVDFLIISLIFVFNCVGFLCGAASNVYMTDRLGLGKVVFIGSLGQTVAYVMITPASPFPVLCLAFAICGWGIGLQDAQLNGFVASLKKNAAAKMGLIHALYGLGAACSPLVATQFAQLRHWSFHFLCSLGIALVNNVILLLVFRGKTQDECLQEIGQEAGEQGTSEQSKYRQILDQKVVHLLAIFSLIYVGTEVTIGGWTVTYIIDERHGGASSGYISTGFFGGLTLGSVALLWLNEKVGERRVIFIYILLAIVFQLIVWLVPSLVGGALAISFVGFVFGPIYPILMNESSRLIPPWLLTGSMGWIGGFGLAGSALFPFLTGALASRFGIQTLQPFLVVLMAVMFGIWALVPKQRTLAKGRSTPSQ